MSYRDRNRKLIALPSGATCTIRKLVGNDFLAIGNIPQTVQAGKPEPQRQRTPAEEAAAVKWGLALQKVIFTRCISAIESEGKKYRIVDKPFGAELESEIAIDGWDQVDAEAVAREVLEFSGMGREAGATSDPTFRPDNSGYNQPAPISEALRPTPEQPVEVIA